MDKVYYSLVVHRLGDGAFVTRIASDSTPLVSRLNLAKETDFILLEKAGKNITDWEWVGVRREDIVSIVYNILEDQVIKFLKGRDAS